MSVDTAYIFSMDVFLFLIILAAVIFVVFWVFKMFKIPKIGCLAMISGGVKTGKSTLSVHMAIRTYRSNLLKWRIDCALTWFFNLFRKDKKPYLEKPLLYSNVPLSGIDFVPVTRSLLLRQTRFAYGSVCYLQEASLIADSRLAVLHGADADELNKQLLLFAKLFGHETKGGTCILDTQQIGDLHISFRRSLSEYLYIHHIVKWIPFFILLYVREDRYSEDGTVVSTYSEDVEETLKCVIVPKSVWKRFDAYCYSVLTDDLPVENRVSFIAKGESLKARKIVSFRKDFEK